VSNAIWSNFILFMCMPLLSGCIPIVLPIPHSTKVCNPRPGISRKADADFIQTGQTDRTQVLLSLGEPDFAWDNDRAFAYVWATSNLDIVAGVFMLGWSSSWGTATNIPLHKKYRLIVEFDDAGIVRQTRWIGQTVREFQQEQRNHP
jgi:outer membrane protein assembly factor BamE (lipoprotein component of BamABCDE complex)